MKKFLFYAMALALLASCDKKEETKEISSWRGPMYFYYLDEKGNDLLNFNAREIQYPVHFPTMFNNITEYEAPKDFVDIIDYGVLPVGSSVTGKYYSGNWSTISYDPETGLYSLYMSMPFSNLTTENEIFYVARSKTDVDTIRAEIIYLTEGIIGGGPNPRYPDVQKLWYNEVLIMDKSSTGNQRAYIVKHRDGTTSVHPKTKPAPAKI